MSATALLELTDIQVSYGAIAAVKQLSMCVYPGEIVTLIGSNGAGKSTTLRAISGLIPVRAGTVALDGAAITGVPAHEIVARGIAHAPEGRRIFPKMTVAENLDLGAFLRRDAEAVDADRVHVLELFPRLAERLGQRAGTMSGGEQQMLAVARAMMAKPRLLLLDEPSMGLAPVLVDLIFETIQRIRAEGTTILLVEQNARVALDVADRAYVLESGVVTVSGVAADLADDQDVIRAYLGG